ncbi:hypothetical protein ACLIBG_14210 [Virgibacillus sp. W0181]
MKNVLDGFVKFFVANLAVVFTIMLLPVFLVTDNVSAMDQIVEYLFNSKG